MFPDQGRNKNLTAAFPARDNPVREILRMAKRKKPRARRSQQRTMFDAAKSCAVQMQNMALKGGGYSGGNCRC